MAEAEKGEDTLYTLSDISQKTGISMPTLQRYKKLYQGRIPSVGSGRKQRYPENALPVFDEIRNENIGRRGRPRKDASAPQPARRRGRPPGSGRKAAATAAATAPRGRRGRRPGRPRKDASAPPPAARRRGRPPGRKNRSSGGLLTLTEISKTTGISYPTLVRYVRLHSDRLPHEGKGRGRRFHPAAVDVFRQLRSESGRGGRKPGRPAGSGRGRAAAAGADTSGLAQRIRAIEKWQQDMEKRFRGLGKLFG